MEERKMTEINLDLLLRLEELLLQAEMEAGLVGNDAINAIL
jgi:hypothetical protein